MLEKRNTAVNVITAILAVLLSILLVISLFATTILTLVSTILTPKGLSNTIQETVQSIDFEQLLMDSAADMEIAPSYAGNSGFEIPDNIDIPEDLEIPENVEIPDNIDIPDELKDPENVEEFIQTLPQSEIVGKIVKTKAAKKVIDLVSADIADKMTGGEGGNLNGDALRTIVEEDSDEILDIVCEYVPDVDREMVRTEVIKFIDNNADTIATSLNNVVVVDTEAQTQTVEMIAALKKAVGILLIAVLVLAAFVYVCRSYRFGGFLWLGVDAIIAGGLVAATSVLLKSGIVSTLLPDVAGNPLFAAATVGIGSQIMKAALILLGIGVFCILLFILLKCAVVNPKLKAAQAAAMSN